MSAVQVLDAVLNISIHALREEGDSAVSAKRNASDRISIHALREEGDERGQGSKTLAGYFYPRPPRGGRRERSRV